MKTDSRLISVINPYAKYWTTYTYVGNTPLFHVAYTIQCMKPATMQHTLSNV